MREAESRRAQLEAVRRQASTVLDRVLTLVTSGSEGSSPPDVPPGSNARATLRATIEHATLPDLPPEAVQLAGGRSYPFQWAARPPSRGWRDSSFDDLGLGELAGGVVEGQFGKPLSVAVAPSPRSSCRRPVG